MLYIVRGIPGSGKTTLAKKLAAEHNALHYEADMFFMQDGVYVFDHTRIKEAHAWCQSQTRIGLSEGRNVVVSNTFVKQWEMKAYLDMYPNATIHVATGAWKNIHGVPDEIVQRMKDTWED